VKLAEAPAENQVAQSDQPDSDAVEGVANSKLGVSVEPVSPEFARTNRIAEDRRGLRVTDVSTSGPAFRRLFRDDVIVEVLYPTPRREVRTVSDLQAVLGKLRTGEYVSLLVYTPQAQGATRVVNLRIGE
jgi:S1-C subfamily serine protease